MTIHEIDNTSKLPDGWLRGFCGPRDAAEAWARLKGATEAWWCKSNRTMYARMPEKAEAKHESN